MQVAMHLTQMDNSHFCLPADLLRELPQLPGYLGSASLANLLACNRELRHTIHSLAHKVTVMNEQDLGLLLKSSWRQLTVVYMPNGLWCGLLWPEDAKLELLARIHLQGQDKGSTIFVVRQRQTTAAACPLQPPPCQQQLITTMSPPIQLSNRALPLSQQSLSTLEQILVPLVLLVPGPCLFCVLLFFGLTQFIFGVFLAQVIVFVVLLLFLVDCFTNRAAQTSVDDGETMMSSMSCPAADRSESQDQESGNKELPPVRLTSAAHRLALQGQTSNMKARPAKRVENVPGTRLKHAVQLMTDIGTDIHSIDMHSTALDDASIAQLLTGAVPQLFQMALTANVLGLRTMSVMVQADKLMILSLADNNLDDYAVQKIVTASWPELVILDLSGNVFGAKGIAHLAQGSWQMLRCLQLAGIQGDYLAVAAMMKADWPDLNQLTLDISLACTEVLALLSLAFDSADTSKHQILTVPRQNHAGLQTTAWTPWPNLHKVLFSVYRS